MQIITGEKTDLTWETSASEQREYETSWQRHLKLRPSYIGPYEIVKKVSPVAYTQ